MKSLCCRRVFVLLALAGFSSVFTGCSEESGKNAVPSVDGAKYLLKKEPGGAKEVIDARKSVKDGDEVVIVGRIGGSENPWIKGRAAFTIVDTSLKSCLECGHDCSKPWDY